MPRLSHCVLAAGAAIFLIATTPLQGRAQYIPQAGFGTFGTTYQFAHANNHLFSTDAGAGDGNRYDMGHMDSQTLLFSGNYVLVNGLVMSGTAAYVSARYLGDQPEHVTDTADFTGAWQDATLQMSYTAAWKGFSFTPTVSYAFPMTDYLTMGHNALGKGVHSFGASLAASRTLYPFVPNGYITAGLGQDFRPQIQIWNLNSTNYDVGAGYYLTPALTLGGHFTYSQAKGGFDWADPYHWSQPNAYHLHDQAAGYLVRSAGGTINYRFTSTYSLGLEVSGVLSGANTTDPMSYSISTNYGFWEPFHH
jgi:hypothetical protein